MKGKITANPAQLHRGGKTRLRCGWVIATLLSLAGQAQAAGVVIGDTEWRQLSETTGLTWNQVATVCNATTGVCSGTVAGVNVTGWTWATLQDVGTLFETLIDPNTINYPSLSNNYLHANDAYIPAAFDSYGFLPSRLNATERAFLGWTRSFPASNPSAAYAPAMRDFFAASGVDEAYLVNGFTKANAMADVGVFLYRGAIVPVPAAGWLLLSAVGGLAACRRREA